MEYLKPNELIDVLAEAKKRGTREHCMFLLAYRCGLRASEIANLSLDDIQDGKITVRRLKDSLTTVRRLESHDNVLLDERKALQAYLRDRGDADGSRMLFISREGSGLSRSQVYRLFDDVAYCAGIDKARRHPHILKHSLGAHLVRQNVSIAYIQKSLGHKHLTSTQVYLGVTDAEANDQATAALGKAFGPDPLNA
jgi:integrase/recombinase XerD